MPDTQTKIKHPKPETTATHRIVYPIFREDFAEAIITPIETKDAKQ